MWKKALALLVAVAIIYGGLSLYRIRHQLFRPNFDSTGGTLFTFDLLAPADDDDLDRACRVLTRRFDADGAEGIVVKRQGQNRLTVAVPNGRTHDDIADRVRRLTARRGRVEFRILANSDDDKEATAEAEKQFTATKDEVPVGPDETSGGKEVVIGRGEFKKKYRWFRLGAEQAKLWMAHSGGVAGGPMRKKIHPGLYGATPIYSYQPAVGGEIHFVLARESGDGERVSGDGIERVRVAGGQVYSRHMGVANHSLQISFDNPTASALLMLSSRNLSPQYSRSSNLKFLACILDGEVFTTRVLDTPVLRKTVFPVWGTATDAEDLAQLLQGGELSVKLKSAPTDAEAVEAK